MYDLESFFKLVGLAQGNIENCYGLMLTNDKTFAEDKLNDHMPIQFHDKVIIRSLSRNHINKYFGVITASTIFLKIVILGLVHLQQNLQNLCLLAYRSFVAKILAISIVMLKNYLLVFQLI